MYHTGGGLRSHDVAFSHNTPGAHPDPRLVTSPAFSHMRSGETAWAHGPDAGFNTCSAMSNISACRRYSGLLRT